ncbi:hypothetical protein CH370_17275 [Leptospira kmetyi]|uniref:Lcl C-terminal domain-containing protein n=1 Tax=Leptospira kmetyi TaxID=408139 RepID=UPI000C2B130E|nr:DUF1566 domain-containing protein [Leptospira kmetyi]PJZ40262.1 hypothetical protein CH370_17275 [Leptospira kmetyi]TGK18271.1 DUF1566 domain-containing protein [Leptospira kmetyi]TGK26653.1 DUF1566 domain-containing protein [Leptospira kmetyi]
MSRNYIYILFILFHFDCIAHPPDKPDPPYTLLNYLINPSGSNNNNNTPTPTPSPSYNPSTISDTGQTLCYNNAGAAIACAGTGQDGEFSDVPNVRSFTGPTQHSQYTNDYTTLDNLRGLVWKTCPEGQTGGTCTGLANQISITNALLGAPGSCQTLNAMNGGNGYAGKTNWRIPLIREFFPLYLYTNVPTHMETTQFPNPDMSALYVANTDDATNAAQAWQFDFLNMTNTRTFAKNTNGILRCVSGNPPPAPSYQVNTGALLGTVTDRNTNLLWVKCPFGKSSTTCAVGVLFVGNVNSAYTNCNNLVYAGRSDWRLPNINELLSLVDHSIAVAPVIPTATFPNFPGAVFWSSTTNPNVLNENLTIDFTNGTVVGTSKWVGARAICVTN